MRGKAAKAARRARTAAAAATTPTARIGGVSSVTGVTASKAGAPSIAEILANGKPNMAARARTRTSRLVPGKTLRANRAAARAATTRSRQMASAMPGKVRRNAVSKAAIANMNKKSRLIAAGGLAALGAGALMNRSGPAADKPVGRPTGMFEF